MAVGTKNDALGHFKNYGMNTSGARLATVKGKELFRGVRMVELEAAPIGLSTGGALRALSDLTQKEATRFRRIATGHCLVGWGKLVKGC